MLYMHYNYAKYLLNPCELRIIMQHPNENNSDNNSPARKKKSRQLRDRKVNAYYSTGSEPFTFQNLVATITNGTDVVCVQGPPHNKVWIFRPGAPGPELLLNNATPEGSITINFFIAAAFNKTGELLAISDAKGYRVIVIDVVRSQLIYVVGGRSGYQDSKAGVALFCSPAGLVFLRNNELVVSDFGNRCIRKITPTRVSQQVIDEKTKLPVNRTIIQPVVTTLAGSPLPVTNRPIPTPDLLSLSNENQAHTSSRLRPVTAAEMENFPRSFLSDGIGKEARFIKPRFIDITPDEKYLYITDQTAVRRMRFRDGKVKTICGVSEESGDSNGEGNKVRFKELAGIAVDANGNIVVVDEGNKAVRVIYPEQNYRVETIDLRGNNQAVALQQPTTVDVDRLTGKVILTDRAYGRMFLMLFENIRGAVQNEAKQIYLTAGLGQLLMRGLKGTRREKTLELIMHTLLRRTLSPLLPFLTREEVIDLSKNSFTNPQTRLRLKNVLSTLLMNRSSKQIYQILRFSHLIRSGFKNSRAFEIWRRIAYVMSPLANADKREQAIQLSQAKLSDAQTQKALRELGKTKHISLEEWEKAAVLRKNTPTARVVKKRVNNNTPAPATAPVAVAPVRPVVAPAATTSAASTTTNTANTFANLFRTLTTTTNDSNRPVNAATDTRIKPVSPTQTQTPDANVDSEMTNVDLKTRLTHYLRLALLNNANKNNEHDHSSKNQKDDKDDKDEDDETPKSKRGQC